DASADAGEIKTGGTLTYAAVGALRHLNGTVQSGLATAVPGTQVNASPLLLDENYEPQPYLAESWEVSDDGLTVTLNLRDNAVFHDGVPITSEDVAFSIFTSKENHPFKPMFEPVESVDTSDPLKAVITLSKPHPAILIAMSPGLLPIIPKHIFDDGQDMQTHPRNGGADFVGSGPFRVVEYDAAELVRLEKFDDFFLEGRPYLDEIIIDIVADPNSVIIGMDNGDYDMATNPNAAAVEQFQNDDRFVVDPKGHEAIGKISWVHLNLRTENLSTREARQAIALAIDQQGWRDIVALGQSTPNITGIQNASPFYNPDATNFDRRDVDEAKALLESVGLADGFELDMPADPSMLPTAEFIKQNLEDINVTLNIRSVPDFPTWAADVAAGNYDVAFTQLWNWGDPVIGVHRSYNCDNRIDPPGVIFSNNSWYCNEEVDALLDKAGSTFDNDERKDLYFQATELINVDVPVVYLGFAETYEIRKTRVQNPPDGVWGFMSPWHEVWLSE
ncbi:MAG: ABC transporter substrate-binding protein, partial [Acidimicrobiales bacterium]